MFLGLSEFTTSWFPCDLSSKEGPRCCPVLSLFPGELLADEFCDKLYSAGPLGELVSSISMKSFISRKDSQSLLDSRPIFASLIGFLHN